MYRLQFRKNASKKFEDALAFAHRLGGSMENGIVTIDIPEEKLLGAYRMMRTIFGTIQNWKGTVAYFNGLEVHPYQFILHAHRVWECSQRSERDPRNCELGRGHVGWGCKKLDAVPYLLTGSGIYRDNNRFWYNYGHFDKAGKWIVNKKLIGQKLLEQGNKKALYLCPFYDEMDVLHLVAQLPDYIVPDNITFMVHYSEVYANGQNLVVPTNIRHVTRANYSGLKFLDVAPDPGSLSEDMDPSGLLGHGPVVQDDV